MGAMYNMRAGGDATRFGNPVTKQKHRSEWRRDFGRVVHSAAWRRLQGKTQLFPGHESDFFRNRLTHSLEVAQIAKSVAIRLNATEKFLKGRGRGLDLDLVEVACLCHDIGHPPFGHNGEEELDRLMVRDGGFEGNAQTLRILARLEKRDKTCPDPTGIDDNGKDRRHGLNLTARTLASVLKYDVAIRHDRHRWTKVKKGYYEYDRSLVEQIKQCVGGAPGVPFKTIECNIMDLADDIAYSTYDVEDALKAGFVTPVSVLGADRELLEIVAENVSKELGGKLTADEVADELLGVFESAFHYSGDRTVDPVGVVAGHAHRTAEEISQNGYHRTGFTSQLVGEAIEAVELAPNNQYPYLSKVRLSDDIWRRTEVLKKFVFEKLIRSPRMKLAAFRGREIVRTIFEALDDADATAYELLPHDFRALYSRSEPAHRKRIICDFIAGMTDRYAIEFYGRLRSERPETIFKPL